MQLLGGAEWSEYIIIVNRKCSTSTVEIPALNVPVEQRVKDAPPYAVGDILLSNGKAISYDKTLVLDEVKKYLTNKSVTAVGVVFYTGKQVGIATSSAAYKNQKALGDRTLAMLIDTTGSTLTFEKTGGVWAITNTSAHTDRKLELIVYDDAGNAPFYNYNGTYSGILDPCEVSSTFLDSNDPNKNMLVFNIPYNPQLSDNIKDAKCYLPSAVELLELYQNREVVRKTLAFFSSSCQSENTFLNNKTYWSSSQFPTITDHAWAVDLTGDGAGTAEHRAKTDTLTVRGVIEYVYPKPKGTEQGGG